MWFASQHKISVTIKTVVCEMNNKTGRQSQRLYWILLHIEYNNREKHEGSNGTTFSNISNYQTTQATERNMKEAKELPFQIFQINIYSRFTLKLQAILIFDISLLKKYRQNGNRKQNRKHISIINRIDFLQFINKTYMASIIKRKQQVNQLRKAHFPFGFENNNGAQSQYRQKYNQQPVSISQPNGDKNSHFTIASDEPSMAKNTYQSQFKQKYPEHGSIKKEAVKRHNDENNIVLGFGSSQKITNYKDQFIQKQQDKVKPVNQRIISVDLGDTLTDFTTSYNKAYDGAQSAKVQQLPNNTSGTHLVLGYDQNNFVTSNAAIHSAKPINNSKGLGRTYGTNINLGSDQNQFNSENKAQFSHKQTAKPIVQKQRVLDFKSAHFKFGFPEQKNQSISQAKANYNEKPLTAIKVQGKKPVNVELKHDSNKYFQSSYGDHYNQKKGEKAEILNKNGRSSNVVIGLGTQTYQSEAKDQYGQKNVEIFRGKGTQGSLVLGDGTRQFTTQYQHSHSNKFGQHTSNRVGKDEISKMRVQNYVNGFTDPDYKLHSQNYGIGSGEGNKLPREVIDKMRSTNIVNSSQNKFYGNTTHKSSFGWKKNDDF